MNGTFNASKTVGEPSDCAGYLGGEVEFTLEGVIKSQQYHFLCFHAGGEAKVGGHATWSADIKAGADGKGPYYQGELTFDGLEIYAVVEGGIEITNGDPPADDPEYGTPDEGDAGAANLGATWTLIPEATLLDSGKHYFLGEEDGD